MIIEFKVGNVCLGFRKYTQCIEHFILKNYQKWLYENLCDNYVYSVIYNLLNSTMNEITSHIFSYGSPISSYLSFSSSSFGRIFMSPKATLFMLHASHPPYLLIHLILFLTCSNKLLLFSISLFVSITLVNRFLRFTAFTSLCQFKGLICIFTNICCWFTSCNSASSLIDDGSIITSSKRMAKLLLHWTQQPIRNSRLFLKFPTII